MPARLVIPMLLALATISCATGALPSPESLPIPLPDLGEDMTPAERLKTIREFKAEDAEAAALRATAANDLRGATCWMAVAMVTREKLQQERVPLAGPLDAFEALRLQLHPTGPADDRVAVACDALAIQTAKYLADDIRQAAALASSMGASGDYLQYAQKALAIIRALVHGRR